MLRYKLKTLLLLVTAVAVLLAIHAARRHGAGAQAETIAAIHALTPRVITQYEFAQDANWGPGHKRYPAWLEQRLGTDYLYSIDAFCLVQNTDPDPVIEQASRLRHLRLVKLPACEITDRSLAPLERLPRLEWLELFRTPVTDEGMKTIARMTSLRKLDLRATKVTDASVPVSGQP
jgi:hypothetical protein